MSQGPYIMLPGSGHSDEELQRLVIRCDNEGRTIERPKDPDTARHLRKVVHDIMANRLIGARNRSGINNNRINKAMHRLYMERRRDPRLWSFTNFVSDKISLLPDSEEIEMLAGVIPLDRTAAEMHLRVIPWAIEDQRDEARRRRKNKEARSAAQRRVSQTISQSNTVQVAESAGLQNSTTSDIGSSSADQPIEPPVYEAEPFSMAEGGDIKISHHGGHIHLHGKIWCTRATAQKLRMIVPLKLLEQSRGDNPWSYEISGPVHDYQLYNLFHILYGTPRVLSVELPEG